MSPVGLVLGQGHVQPLDGTGPEGQGWLPSIDSPANDRQYDQGQKQAAWGHRLHRPAVLGGKGVRVHGGGRGTSMGGN